ncbi:hypothetical protein ACFL09_06810 [Planctomycetota bacterium]
MAKHPGKCPKCGGRVDYDSAAGDRITCAQCGASIAVPGRAEPSSDSRSPTLAAPCRPRPSPRGRAYERVRVLGQFEILELLGRGGMGAVYKARQTSLNRLVAVKVLPDTLAADASFVERFAREARSAAAVTHANIIEVLEESAVRQDEML